MGKLLKIGIVGCGAIGSSIARAVRHDFSDKAVLSGVYDIDRVKATALAFRSGNKKLLKKDLRSIINDSDLIVEASSARSSYDIAMKAISSSKDIMIMSVGGILDSYPKLVVAAQRHNSRIYIPSGAVCGIDAVKASSGVKIKRLTLTTTKPPLAFSGVKYVIEKKIALDRIKHDTVIFEGNALAAVKNFPQNINVAAVISLAGIGPRKTRVRIVASPGLKRNVHEIEVESEAGRVVCRVENTIHPDNPKTSYLAVLSALATLRQILDPARVGT